MDDIRVWSDDELAAVADLSTNELPSDPKIPGWVEGQAQKHFKTPGWEALKEAAVTHNGGPPVPDRLVQVSLKNLGLKSRPDESPGKGPSPLDVSVDGVLRLVHELRSSGIHVRRVSIMINGSVSVDIGE